MHQLRLGMAQLNTTVGDFEGNYQKILESISQARSLAVDLLTFPELAICGYPPEDLLLKQQFTTENLRYLDKVVKASLGGLTIVVGFVDGKDDLFNAAAIIHDGRLAGVYHKTHLPNYGVFDEKRYFGAGKECPVYVIAGIGIGINICEDLWHEAGPASAQAHAGAEVIVNISASPYHHGKAHSREKMLRTRALDNVAIVAYNNLVGGQDELVFDGNSMILDEVGQLLAQGKQFEEDLLVVDLDVGSVSQARLRKPKWEKGAHPLEGQGCQTGRIVVSKALSATPKPPLPPRQLQERSPSAEIYDALVLGTHDYVGKNGFEKVAIGLSGGIDSSLVAAIAVDALGPKNVIAVAMPSRYSSAASISDAGLLAQNLGIRLLTIPIEKVFKAYLDMLVDAFANTEPNVAEENIQARIRGNILMALSNKFGWLVLPTGNKSEMATGYTTLYGDMAGGFAVIKDVTKTMVYQLANYRNSLAGSKLIPSSIIDKVPSAELKPDQRDSDTLPPYDLLDPVLTAYVEEDKSIEQLIAQGINAELAKKTAQLVDSSEYKRRQAPPGIKITPKAFGRDRRLPITNAFKGVATL